ncbi:hypothetical protein [Streptococcus suis]|uniref:hypothetical protein n=1 Tax=Streptococcus suis TaxID=1307 RepID=UPI00211DB4B8|nr:hypothetical protein [Streptococcus suis]
MTKIIIFLTKILVKKKKKCYNDIKIRGKNEFIRQEKESWGITMKKINSNKKGILITGTSVVRAVEIGSILLLAYILLSDLLGWSDMDTALITTLIASIACIESSLQMEKKVNK